MSLSDPIADMLTRIRNGCRARHEVVSFPGSRLKRSIVDILKTEGFIKDYYLTRKDDKSNIEVELKYHNARPVITQLERVSKPGLRCYVPVRDLRPTRNNMGISIVSTSKGVMTGRRAIQMRVGGEIICRVW